MRTLAFVDLDGSLFSVDRDVHFIDGPECVTVDEHGDPAGFTSKYQRHFLKNVLGDAELIAVTERDEAAFRRVNLPLGETAILDHGATVLNRDGRVDRVWAQVMRELLADSRSALLLAAQAAQDVSALHQLECQVSVREQQGIPMLVEVRHPLRLKWALDEMHAQLKLWLAESPPMLSVKVRATDGTIFLLPDGLNKESAVAYVLDREREEGDVFSIGVGDALSDAPFLNVCDYAVTPRESAILQLVLMSDTDE